MSGKVAGLNTSEQHTLQGQKRPLDVTWLWTKEVAGRNSFIAQGQGLSIDYEFPAPPQRWAFPMVAVCKSSCFVEILLSSPHDKQVLGRNKLDHWGR